MRHVLPLLRVAIALVLFLATLPAVFPVPTPAAWAPSLLATEWGHGLAGLAIALLLLCFADPRVIEPAVLSAAAALLGLVPVGRAVVWRLEGGQGIQELRLLAWPGSPMPAPQPFGPDQRWQLFLAQGDKAPLAVVVSSGPWGADDPTGGAPALVSWLVEAGLSVVVMPPPKGPSVRTHPELREALTWLQSVKDAPFDAKRPVLVGRGDAGRQWALLVNERPDDFRGLLISSAPADLGWAMGERTWLGPIQPGEGARQAIGEEAAGKPEPLVAGSPALQRWPALPPTLLIHGGRDPWVDPEHARRLQAVWNEQGRDSLLVELPWALPGFELAHTGPSAWVLAPLVKEHARRWASNP